MSNSIIGFLNLLKIRGSKSIENDGEEGIFIPYKRNGAGVFKSEVNGVEKANLRIIVVQYKDKFGNDFMVIRCKTGYEFAHKKKTEIFGNLSFTADPFITLEPNEDYEEDITNYLGESNNNEEKEVDL